MLSIREGVMAIFILVHGSAHAAAEARNSHDFHLL
jgi:hypothetical protein